MKVLIINAIALNVGDAAILLGEIRALREAFGESLGITVAEQRPDVAARIYPDIRFVPGLVPWRPGPQRGPRWAESWRRRRTTAAVRLLGRFPRLARLLLTAEQRDYLREVAAADVVVSTGGTYFVEHYNFTTKADELLAAEALGKPTFLYTQSLGPFTRAESGATMRRIVDGSTRVFLRDERSRGHLLAIGADASKLEVHCDAAFALARMRGDLASPPRAVSEPPREARPVRRRVAVSVRAWALAREDRSARGEGDAESRYRRAVAALVTGLSADGAEVDFVSTCQGLPEFSDDSRYAQRLVDELLPGVAGVRVDSTFRRPEELATALEAYDLAVCTRMHFLILALAARTPVVAIAYEFKSRELMRSLGMEHLVADYEDVTGDWLVARAREVLDEAPAIRARIAAQVERLRVDAVAPAHVIRRALAARNGNGAHASPAPPAPAATVAR